MAPPKKNLQRVIVPDETILQYASPLRIKYPEVSNEEAAFVHLLVQTGQSIPDVAQLLNVQKQWAYYHLRKQPVADYMRELSVQSLGVAGTQALTTMAALLNSKSQYIRFEAARDLLDRAGMRADTPASSREPVDMTFNISVGVVGSNEPVPVVIDHEP